MRDVAAHMHSLELDHRVVGPEELILFGKQLGYKLKLLAIAKVEPSGDNADPKE